MPSGVAVVEADPGRLMDRAGDRAFEAKSRGLWMELCRIGADDVAHGAVMEAMGYALNRRPFRELAARVPFTELLPLRDEPNSVRLLGLRAILLRASGLLSLVEPPAERALLARLCTRMPGRRPMRLSRWRRFRVRPANHPVRRVEGAARLVERFLNAGPAACLVDAVRSGDASSLLKYLAVPGYLGESRAIELGANVVLPFVHAWSRMSDDGTLRARCVAIYRELPPPAGNEVTREMASVLGAGGRKASSARRHLGLMRLYRQHVGRIPPG